MYLDELNEAQRQAVEYVDGPSLVVAGAGSGKTRVLTYKIAYLLEQGMAPWNILALTFTNKAADEMKARIATLVGEERARHLWMGTFHSVFARILRTECQFTGFTSDFTIYDTQDSKSIIKTLIKERGLDDKVYKPAVILNRISWAKNRLMGPDAYMRDVRIAQDNIAAKIPETGSLYQAYMSRCRLSNAMDFDDILVYTYILFSQYPEVKERYAERFHFVLVDEYQDTNYAQHVIVWQLTEHNQRVCVVGDDAQSIYSFRGANLDNILKFGQTYRDTKLFKLEQNYRSTQNIVNAANSLIHKNQRQIEKTVFSRKEAGEHVHVHEFYSDIEEAAGVARKIEYLHRYDHLTGADIAILYRTNAQSRTFEEEFRKRGIPYRVYGGLSFYQRKEIKDAIAYFRLLVNHHDEEALKRIINYPTRGLGQTTLLRIISTATTAGVSCWTVMHQPEAYQLDVNRGTLTKIQNFVQLIEGFDEQLNTLPANEIGRDILDKSTMIKEIYSGREPEDISRQENLQELIDGMAAYVSSQHEEGSDRYLLTHYLQEVSLLSETDEDDTQDGDRVSLMTVHAAKGLEFRAVFIVGMEENLFPGPQANESMRELEEERRLFYVALTRAEERCYVSYANTRYKYGKPEFCRPSRFIAEIDGQFLEYNIPARQGGSQQSRYTHTDTRITANNTNLVNFRPLRPTTDRHTNTDATPPNGCRYENLHVGMLICHQRFGNGTIQSVSGTGLDTKIQVDFDNCGLKTLLVRFAVFDIIG